LTLVERLIKRFAQRKPQFGEIWYIRDANSGVIQRNPTVDRHPALITREPNGEFGDVIAVTGSSTRQRGPGAFFEVDVSDMDTAVAAGWSLRKKTRFWGLEGRSCATSDLFQRCGRLNYAALTKLRDYLAALR
jgi:hypothetical protein